MERMFGPVLYDAFRQIKRTFDPDGLFNPGKIVDAPPLSANLRYGPAYRTVPVTTFFDYSDYGGLAGAVEMCSGLGACRKVHQGTMCPSFMATREEAHSTRGRANALRLALAGKLGDAGLSDDALHRGARSVPRVPGVQGRVSGRRGRRADEERVPGRVLAPARHARARARARPCRSRRAVGQPVRARLERALAEARRFARSTSACSVSIAGARRRPGTRQTFRRRFARRHPERSATVALFADTFTNHYHPSVGMAGLDVIERLGYGVTLAPNVCCGRPLISQGLLDEARRRARENADRLFPLAEARAGDRVLRTELPVGRP